MTGTARISTSPRDVLHSACRYCTAFVLSLCALAAHAAQGPADMLRTMSEEVLAVIHDDPEIIHDPVRVRAVAERLVLPHVDFDAASQWVLGKYWRIATEQQRDDFVAAFRELLVTTYLRSISGYKERKFVISEPRPGQPEGRSVVDAEIEQPGGPPVKVMFRLHKPQERWLVYDIAIEGISLVTTHRSGFADEIRNKGLDSLIARLNRSNNGDGDGGQVQPEKSRN